MTWGPPPGPPGSAPTASSTPGPAAGTGAVGLPTRTPQPRVPARQGWGSGRHFLPVPCSGPSSVPGTPPAPQCPVLSLHGCGLMGPSVWGKGSLVSLLLPALRQRVHDLGRENQVRSPAGSWLPGLQQPGSPWCSAGQGYKACTSSLHPSAHPPAPKRTSPVHPNAHLSAARCTSPLHPNACPPCVPMRAPPACPRPAPRSPAHRQPRGVLAC